MGRQAASAGRKRPGALVWLQRLLVAGLLCPLLAGVSQVAPASQQGSSRPSLGSDRPGMNDPMGMPDPHKLEKMREEDRHKRLQADTAKLVQLTNELKDEVDKTSRDELSVDVVKKAAEIEKLARDVKERMRS